MTFREAEKELLALGDEVLTMKFGLRNMRTLLRALGSPHRRFPSVHVGGTNGKGSVCAMLDSVFRASGHHVGLFTSPHLISIRERIKVDGRNIPPAEFVKSYQRVSRTIQKLRRLRHLPAHPTYFETITALAFDYFARQRIDIAVLEVGMGGRLDSTNIVRPLVSVITNVEFDHERFLGNTIPEIAFEKAGIIKPRVPVITGARRAEALRVIQRTARARKAPLIECWKGTKVSRLSSEKTRSNFTLQTPRSFYRNLEVPLAGRHQITNAFLAIRALEEVADKGICVPVEAVVRGLASTRWPGRFERVARHPEIFLDGAHNPAGAQALRRLVQDQLPNQSVILIYGAMRDKKIQRVFRQLRPLASQVIFTRPQIRRAALPDEIFSVVGEPDCPSFLTANLPQALRLGRRLAKTRGTILITGSLYLVGEARHLLVRGEV